MKIVVTGGAGFIGSHLVEALIAEKNEVHILDNLTTGKYEYIHPKAIIHSVDIRSKKAKEIIMKEKPELVFHLAAQADVAISIENPLYDTEVNVNGTINLLEACRQANVRKIIFSSTSAVYGNLQKELIKENDDAHPISYYGLSKWTAEKYMELYSNLFGLSYTILRYGNVYGPRQTAKGEGGVVAVFLDKIRKDMTLNVHGDGEQTRDFVFVKDVVAANLAAARYGNKETIHISTSNNTSVNQLVSRLAELHGDPIHTNYTAARTGDIKHSCLDNTKAKQILHWHPQYTIYSGLEETYLYSKNQPVQLP
ncbi:NAD-dependent epimerase/dehydratase family protein [Niallia sp. 03133]|uniref:NAD-dependent epimerase/dehydratase family protein n=1 Tax=Niallia sp. 03133 TaxID=3458060 RepID=UPI004043F643